MKGIYFKRIGIGVALLLVAVSWLTAQGNQGRSEADQRLLEDIVAAYETLGERGFSDYIKREGGKFHDNFLIRLARWGRFCKSCEWLTIAEQAIRTKKSEHALAYVLVAKGESYLTREMDVALAALDEAIGFLTKYNDKRELGSAFRKKAIIVEAYEGAEAGIEMLKKAVSFSRAANDNMNLGFEYLQLGMAYHQLGKSGEAFEYLEKSFPYLEKSQNIRGMAAYRIYMGRIYLENDDYEQAERFYLQGSELYKKIGAAGGIGECMKGVGDVYFFQGDYGRANEYYDIAEMNLWESSSMILIGDIYLNKGEMYGHEGDYLEAFGCYNHALPIYRELHDVIGQGDVHKKIGDIFILSNQYDEASQSYLEAQNFYETQDVSVRMGDVFKRRGDVLLFRKHYDQAEQMFEKALEYYCVKEESVGLANTFKALGDVNYEKGDASKALEYFYQSLIFYEQGKNLIGQGVAYSRIADVEHRRENLEKALKNYDRAIVFHRRAGDIDTESLTRFERSFVLERMGKIPEAKREFQMALELFELSRTRAAFHSLKKGYMKNVLDFYQHIVRFMLRRGFKEEAFRPVDAMKARLFLDQLAEGRTPLKKGRAPELTEKHNRLIAQLSDVRLELHQTDSKDKRTLARLEQRKKVIQSELDRLMITIRSENPVYSSVHYPQPMTLDVLRKTLKPNETLVQYVVTPEKIFAFIVSQAKERFKIVPLKITVEEFGDRVGQLKKLLRDSEANQKTLNRIALILYRGIFRPLEEHLCESNDIIIVPDGGLALIPFESLIVERPYSKDSPKYLLEKYKISYIQSASVLKMVRDHYRRPSKTNRFIGFGDPVYDYENFSQGKPEKSSGIPHRGDTITESLRGNYEREGGIYNRLKNSKEELTKIGKFFTKLANGESVLRLRDHAVEEEVKSKTMKDYDYIHLACHGLLSDDFQSLVLSQNIPTQTDNGFLTLNEIMNCDFNAKLVVLSACQSGAGKLEKGEGVTGLTRAVMYAGTPAVIASLWTVDDKATKELMVKFYENLLKRKMSKAEALRQAKLSLLESKEFLSPRLWSAFVLYGE